MARFFIAGTNFPNGRAIIRGRDADHIRVLRLRAGDDIVICDGAGRDYKCRLVQTLEHEAEAEVIEVVPCKAEPTVRTTVFAGLPKGERSDYGSRVRTLAAARRDQTFLVHVRDKIIPLKREDIAFCYTCNEKVTAYTFAGASYPLDKTLEALQAVLPEADFFRANRQFIVARRAVKEISVWFGSRLSLSLVLETPERIVISKARVPEFKAWLTSVQPAE